MPRKPNAHSWLAQQSTGSVPRHRRSLLNSRAAATRLKWVAARVSTLRTVIREGNIGERHVGALVDEQRAASTHAAPALVDSTVTALGEAVLQGDVIDRNLLPRCDDRVGPARIVHSCGVDPDQENAGLMISVDGVIISVDGSPS